METISSSARPTKLGHFGVKRTYSLLARHYHWRSMHAQVRDVIAKCEQCDRVRTSFYFWQLMFCSLPIRGMFYRWSCDLVKELPQTFRGHVYIMIMIEHFSKWVKLIALLDKSSHNTSQAFLLHVATLFRAKCGGESQHSQSWELGVLRDSRTFRARQQGPKHFASRRSWCPWIVLET
jgi:hypothetical protein